MRDSSSVLQAVFENDITWNRLRSFCSRNLLLLVVSGSELTNVMSSSMDTLPFAKCSDVIWKLVAAKLSERRIVFTIPFMTQLF
jgi:hypothetical protein